MSVERSRYWVFLEQDLDTALDAYIQRQIRERDIRPEYGPVLRTAVCNFLDAPELEAMDMRRGGLKVTP